MSCGENWTRGVNFGGPPESVGAKVVLHPAWVERVPVEVVAREMMKWDRWLVVEVEHRTGKVYFLAEPAEDLLNIIPARSERA